MIKRLVAFFLSFVLIFISVPSFAVYDPNPKHSKWFHDSIVNDPLTKSAVEVKAQRTYPVTVVDPATGAKDTITKAQRSVVKLTPPAAQVGKRLMKGGLGGVITQALIGLGISAVDWVLDPENNSLKYKEPAQPSSPTNKYIWSSVYSGITDSVSAAAAAKKMVNQSCTLNKYQYCSEPYSFINTSETSVTFKYKTGTESNPTERSATAFRRDNPDYVPDAPEPAYRYVPIETVAQQVIKDAAGGDAPAMQAMKDTALDMLEAGLLDSPLESSADPKDFGSNESDPLGGSSPTPEPETDPDGDTGGETPNPNPQPEGEPFQLPPFCDWAVVVCDFIEWYQEEPDNSDTEIDLPEPDTEDVDTDIDFGGSCPDDFGFTADFRIFQFEFVLMPFSKFCPLLSTYIKPVLVVLGSYMAILIVGGRRDV